MTMSVKHLAIAGFAIAALALAGSADAGEVIRLSLPGDQAKADTLNLKASNLDLALESEDARYYRGGGFGYGGGYRGGFVGGYRGGYGGFGYGGYRGGYYGGYRGGYYGGYYGGYRGFAGGYYGYRSYAYYPQYYSSYYIAPQYYGYYNGYNGYGGGYGGYGGYGYGGYAYAYPCTETVLSTPPPVSYRIVTNPTITNPQIVTPGPTNPGPTTSGPTLPPPTLDDGKGTPGTFPYDGGPKDPVPLPKEVPSMGVQQRPAPRVVEDMVVRLDVSATTKTGGSGAWQYPAYGEAPRRKSNGTTHNTKFELIPYGRAGR